MKSYITEYLELPETIHLPEDTEVTADLVKKLLDKHQSNIKRYQILQEYYEGKAKILERRKRETKSNNKLVLDYPSYIVDMLLGLFVGKPVNYMTSEENESIMQALQDVFDLNDEQDENTEIAKMAGIKGRAYEIIYLDEEANVRFNEIEPENVIYIYDDKIKPAPLMALYVRDINTLDNLDSTSKDRAVTVYTRNKIFEFEEIAGNLTLIDEDVNMFGEVNVIEILNNDEGIGDFERVLSLIDAMNLLQSDTANDFEEFTDAMLVLYGMLGADAEDIKQMQQDRVLLMDNSNGSKQSAEWLIKNINDNALENYKTRLDKDIHKFAKVPNMADEHFASNVSGESMKYKLFATDQIISQKQRKFKTALQERIKLIFNVMNIKKSSDFDYRDIAISFNDNKPFNELDNANMVKTLMDFTSKQFALSKLRDIDDVAEEIKRQEEEQDAYADLFLREVGADDEEDVQADSKRIRDTSEKETTRNNQELR